MVFVTVGYVLILKELRLQFSQRSTGHAKSGKDGCNILSLYDITMNITKFDHRMRSMFSKCRCLINFTKTLFGRM